MPYTPPPPQPRHYRRAAENLRRLAERIDQHADATDPRSRGSLTSAIHGLATLARTLSERHRGDAPGAAERRRAEAIEREVQARVAESLP